MPKPAKKKTAIGQSTQCSHTHTHTEPLYTCRYTRAYIYIRVGARAPYRRLYASAEIGIEWSLIPGRVKINERPINNALSHLYLRAHVRRHACVYRLYVGYTHRHTCAQTCGWWQWRRWRRRSPIFQFAIAIRVFNYNEHNGGRRPSEREWHPVAAVPPPTLQRRQPPPPSDSRTPGYSVFTIIIVVRLSFSPSFALPLSFPLSLSLARSPFPFSHSARVFELAFRSGG